MHPKVFALAHGVEQAPGYEPSRYLVTSYAMPQWIGTQASYDFYTLTPAAKGRPHALHGDVACRVMTVMHAIIVTALYLVGKNLDSSIIKT